MTTWALRRGRPPRRRPALRWRLVEDSLPTLTVERAIVLDRDEAREAGVDLRPDDDMLVLCRPGEDRAFLEGFVAALRADGQEVIWEW